jgi:glycerophosphoryl diester phosphodiesterase
VVLNIELKDLPGEPGWDGDQLLARRVAVMLLARPLEYWPPQGLPAAATPPAGPGAASGVWPARLHVVVSSFDAASLARFRNDVPGAAVALLLDTAADWRRELASAEGLRAVHPAEADAQPELFAAAAACHLAVVPWTVDDPRRAVELAALGAAGLITNKPRALLRALR